MAEDLRWGWPLDDGVGWISGRFGDWYDDGAGGRYQHRGWDIAASEGSAIRSPCDGVVSYHINDGSFGPYSICIRHESGLYVLLAHNSASYVYVGQTVTRGQPLIGRVGSMGRSSGPHIHLQICANNSFPTAIAYSRDPADYYHPEDDMPDPRTDKLIAALGGEMTIDGWNANGNSLLAGYTDLYNRVGQMQATLQQMQATLEAVRQQTYGINDLLHAWRTGLAMQGINLP